MTQSCSVEQMVPQTRRSISQLAVYFIHNLHAVVTKYSACSVKWFFFFSLIYLLSVMERQVYPVLPALFILGDLLI